MGLYNKIKWTLGILVVFLLVIFTNLSDRNNFLKVSEAVKSIYEDRLVVKDLLIDITNKIHKKEIAAITADSIFYARENEDLNSLLESNIAQYQQTKLTRSEGEILNRLIVDYEELKKKELAYIQSGFSNKSNLFAQYQDIKNDLTDLAKIQLREGNKQFEISKKAMDMVGLFTQIELYVLVFLAVIIQIIVLYNPKKEEL